LPATIIAQLDNDEIDSKGLNVYKFGLHVVFLATAAFSTPLFASLLIHHELTVNIAPSEHKIAVEDRLSFSNGTAKNSYTFYLHKDLKVEASEGMLTPIPNHETNYPIPINAYSVTPDAKSNKATLSYSGKIYHPAQSAKEEYGRSFGETPGLIGEEGIYLAQTSAWYPLISNSHQTFNMNISAPKPWKIVSQGERVDEKIADRYHVNWKEMMPQEEIYLIGAHFNEYNKFTGSVDAYAFLREPDAALAQRYLDVTAQYIEMYRELIGPYPYTKFALVENFWETGYGMPSFTLLGPQVIRLPFILHSSYPHEILHNWWGNSVYVDYSKGNWAEGLTAYLSDHLIKEQRNGGPAFRRNILQGYADFVGESKDFALTDFTSRHSASSEAIGYGKTQMLFNMLRKKLGDRNFIRGLKIFYRQFKYKEASFDDLQQIYSEITEQDLSSFFEQWVKRVGAPQVVLGSLMRKEDEHGWKLVGKIKQTQAEEFYTLAVPVVVTLAGKEKAHQTTITMNGKSERFALRVPAEPIRIDIDPEFDIFRRLDRAEIPPALSQAFGDAQALMILPSSASSEMIEAYQQMIKTWQQTQATKITPIFDSNLDSLPNDKSIWILGSENKFASDVINNLSNFHYSASKHRINIEGSEFSKDNSIVLPSRSSDAPKHGRILITTDNPKAIPGLARKLPHYRKYSYLVFKGDEPTNIGKGQWTVSNSPMSYAFTKEGNHMGKLAARHALAQLPPAFSQEKLMEDIKALAAPEMEGRGIGSQGLDKAAAYIANAFKHAGLQAAGDNDSYFQRWTKQIDGLNKSVELKNVIAVLPGNNPKLKDESVVISAHYDHLGYGWPDVKEGNKGKLHPGADDNASAVAIMLELARIAGAGWKPERNIVFVAFTAEELNKLGSRYYVNTYKKFPAKKAIAAVNLDTVGRLGNAPVTVFGADSATEWKHLFRGVGFVTGIKFNLPSESIGASDEKSFHEIGIPAVQLFGSMHSDYHTPGDTIDKIDMKGILKITSVLKETIDYLAARPEPLTSTLSIQNGQKRKPVQQGRRVSLGSIPDFNYSGPGVLISGTTPKSPAENAGLKKGDIIIKIDEMDIPNLRVFAKLLRGMKPGDEIRLSFKRDNIVVSKSITLKQR